MELSQRAGLSAATITNVAAELLQETIILESGSLEPEGGRPATLLAINPHYGYIVGVDLGETHVQLELFDLALKNLLTVRRLLQPDENSPETIVDFIVAGLDELIARSGIEAENILGVGIGVPGVVECNHGVGVLAPLWRWQNVPLLDMLRGRIAYPIYLDNGAKAMTLAESWFGAGKGVQDLAVILIGTGIGAGVIIGGKMHRGITNAAGEWGHTKIALAGRACRCGSQGCVEAYAGAQGLVHTIAELSPDNPLLGITDQLAFVHALAQQTEQPENAAAIRLTAQHLAVGIANLINLLNPELILLGGWVGLELGPHMLPALNEFVSHYTLPPAFRPVTIRLCELGEDAVCIGAACLVLEELLSIQ